MLHSFFFTDSNCLHATMHNLYFLLAIEICPSSYGTFLNVPIYKIRCIYHIIIHVQYLIILKAF